MADDGHRHALERLGEVPGRTRMEVVQDAAVHRITKGKGTADVSVVFPVRLAPRAAGGEEVHAIDITLPTQKSVGTVRVQDLRGFGAEGFHQFLHYYRIS